jgi:hypothetical protein
LRTPTLRETLGKGGFPRAKVAMQTNDVASLDLGSNPHSDAARLLRAAAEKFDGV